MTNSETSPLSFEQRFSDALGLTSSEHIPSPEELSYQWFRDHGLLRDLMTRYGSKISQAIEALRTYHLASQLQSEVLTNTGDPREVLNDASFWSQLSADISLQYTPNPKEIHKFFTFADPQTKTANRTGKYSDWYGQLTSVVYYEKRQQNPSISFDDIFTAVDRLLYERAPSEVQTRLLKRFPKNFAQFANIDDERSREELLLYLEKEEAKPVHALLQYLPLVPRDRQKAVILQLSLFLLQKLGLQGQNPSYIQDHLFTLFNPEILTSSEDLTLEKIFRDQLTFITWYKESATSTEVLDLIDAMEEHILLPIAISCTYKSASIFWSTYFEKGGSREHAGEAMDRFLHEYITQRIPEGKTALIHVIEERLLPRMRSYFFTIADAYQHIDYFSPKNSDDEDLLPHVLLHQVEGIAKLMQETGILADEPGTGKTLMLLLAALNRIEQQATTKNAAGTILVVAGKTPLNVWEEQIKQWIDLSRVESINVNAPPVPSRPYLKLDSNASLTERLFALKKALEREGKSKRILLVNYDVFRNSLFQQRILSKHPFDVCIIDEAHNIRTKDLTLTESTADPENTSITAQRTKGLYRFISEHPEMRVMLATATPYVKSAKEPLILAHLAAPHIFTKDAIEQLLHSEEEAHAALRGIMLRRRKKEVSNLPEKHTRYIPLSLSSLSEADQEEFLRIEASLRERCKDNPFAYFYATLALENQVKYTWLTDTVKDLVQAKKKVVIFTPFVHGEDRYTSMMSTSHIAHFLKDQGISRIGLLDGTVDPSDRTVKQDRFKLPFSDEKSLDVIIGNYQTAGESITLCSPENNATEVILFVSPNTVSKYIQAVDRIHRYGQTRDVTIYVPFVTGDILNRARGTYDERIVTRMYNELSTSDRIIDGLYFVEPPDFYKEIIQDTSDQPLRFSLTQATLLQSLPSEYTKKKKRPWEDDIDFIESSYGMASAEEEDAEERYNQELSVWMNKANFAARKRAEQRTSEDGDVDDSDFSESTISIVKAYEDEVHQFPLLTFEDELDLGQTMKEGSEALALLSSYGEQIPPEMSHLASTVAAGEEAYQKLVNSNYRLVLKYVSRYVGHGTTSLDLIQEGNLGLLRAAELYDHERGLKFSTYAVFWIRQYMQRSVHDTGRTIRIPVHMSEKLPNIRKVQTQILQETGETPSFEALTEELLKRYPKQFVGITAKEIESMLVSSAPIQSLDASVLEDDDGESLYNFVPSLLRSVEHEVTESYDERLLHEQITPILTKYLTEREQTILNEHIMNDDTKTLEEIGEEYEVSRERIRQVEEKALNKIRFALTPIYEQLDALRNGKDDDKIHFENRRNEQLTEPLVEAIFTLNRMTARVAYRNLYIQLTNEMIAHELGITELEVVSHLYEARIKLWNILPMKEADTNENLIDRLRYFPRLNPQHISSLFEQNKHQFDAHTQEVVSLFFGFGYTFGVYQIERVAEYLNMSTEQVDTRLRKALRILEGDDLANRE
ncbi:MAG: sigma-70 family RNA polymerase sigma factor [Candidatus Woesebacteria bacterium]